MNPATRRTPGQVNVSVVMRNVGEGCYSNNNVHGAFIVIRHF